MKDKAWKYGLLAIALTASGCGDGGDEISAVLGEFDLRDIDGRSDAVENMRSIAADDPSSVREFLVANREQDFNRTYVCLNAITMEDPTGSLVLISDFYADRDPLLRLTVIGAIGKSENPEIHSIVLEATSDVDESVRAMAFSFLVPWKDDEALKIMVDSIESETSDKVVANIIFKLRYVETEEVMVLVEKHLHRVTPSQRKIVEESFADVRR